MGAETVPVSEGVPRPDAGQKYICLVDGVWQTKYDGGSSGAATVEVDGGVDDAHDGLDGVKDEGKGLAEETESGADVIGSESRADAQKDGPAVVVDAAMRINVGAVSARVDDGVGDRMADRIARRHSLRRRRGESVRGRRMPTRWAALGWDPCMGC